jgi:hypothetical protein
MAQGREAAMIRLYTLVAEYTDMYHVRIYADGEVANREAERIRRETSHGLQQVTVHDALLTGSVWRITYEDAHGDTHEDYADTYSEAMERARSVRSNTHYRNVQLAYALLTNGDVFYS